MERLLLFLGFMALGSGLIYLLAVRDSPPRDAELARFPSNVLTMEEVVVKEHEGGHLTLELFARRAQFDERANTALLEQVRFRVFGPSPSGGREVTLQGRAGRAKLDKQAGTIVLIGKVRIINAEGAEIRSGRIEYEQRRERMISPGRVWVTTPEGTHRGDSLVYEVAREKMTFTAPVFFQ